MLTKLDRERVARVTSRIEDCYRRADEADNDTARAQYLRAARGFERTRQYYRTFPLGIWLISASIAAVSVPWALLSYFGAPTVGAIFSAVIAVVVIGAWHRRGGHGSALAAEVEVGERDHD